MVVEALREMNGFAKASAVKQWIADTLTSKGIEVPAITLASGASKFTNDIQWARMYLVNAGILEPVEIAGRGNWKLTEKGKEIALDQETAQKIYDSSAAGGNVAESENTAAPDEEGKQARYRIVGPDELDLKQGLISIDSPLARALIGKALDAEVQVQTPTGEQWVYIVAIDYP